MQLHTFRGSTMAQTLVLVKQALGKDAVIVHTRTFKIGGVIGVGAKEVIEITALSPAATTDSAQTDPMMPTPSSTRERPHRHSYPIASILPSTNQPHLPSTPSAPPHSASNSASLTTTAQRPGTAPADSRLASSALNAPSTQVMRVRQKGTAASFVPGIAPTTPPADATPAALARPNDLPRRSNEQSDDIWRELRDIRTMIQRLDSTPAAISPAHEPLSTDSLPPTLFAQHLHLVRQDVTRELADRILREVRQELSPAALGSAHAVRDAVLARLSALIPVSRSSVSPVRPSASEPFALALVGPTGVGKTSTIAKLASAYKVHQGRSVALITTDTSRVGAVEQLAGFANLVGVPFAAAGSAADLADAAAEFTHADILLIDTAGVPLRDTSRMAELRALLSRTRPTETHLVLSGTMSEQSMLATARAFTDVMPNRVLFTKLDETVTFGVILSVAAVIGTELSFITDGQELTGNIQTPRAERLAQMVLAAA